MKYKIFMQIHKDRKVYMSNPLPESLRETLRTVEVYKKSNPKPYYFIEAEDGTIIEP